jgi:large conductance mechanosensitive channel
MLKEFKKFILTGNVIELAVAVILAGAIGLVVKGFVSMIMMPIIGMFTGGISFTDMKYILSEAQYKGL